MTGSAYAHGLISVLRELGIEVDGSVVFHHDPVYDGGGENQNSLKNLVEEYGDIPHYTVSKTQAYQPKRRKHSAHAETRTSGRQ